MTVSHSRAMRAISIIIPSVQHIIVHKFIHARTYCSSHTVAIAGNFRGRKLSRIPGFVAIRESFLREIWCSLTRHELAICESFLRENCSFLPRKFPAIRYIEKSEKKYSPVAKYVQQFTSLDQSPVGVIRQLWVGLARSIWTPVVIGARFKFYGSIWTSTEEIGPP